MKKTFLTLALSCLLLLSGCGSQAANGTENETGLRLACTTYPVYLLTQAVTDGVEEVSVNLVIDQEVSCLHDYTLTMQDMEAVESADVILLNGAGLEDFLSDVLEGRESIDCSAGIELRWNEEEQEEDPHIWLDPDNAAIMVQNISDGLCGLDPDNAEAYRENADAAVTELAQFKAELAAETQGKNIGLVTFHDGFGYFAEAFGFALLAAVEEEEGSEASAKTVQEIIEIVEENQLPAIFTEVNGSDATAQTIARECGIETYPLSMGMSGDGYGLEGYEAVLRYNIDQILEAFA